MSKRTRRQVGLIDPRNVDADYKAESLIRWSQFNFTPRQACNAARVDFYTLLHWKRDLLSGKLLARLEEMIVCKQKRIENYGLHDKGWENLDDLRIELQRLQKLFNEAGDVIRNRARRRIREKQDKSLYWDEDEGEESE